jgi:DNA-directed RNA polymerase subunit RPC12/RpoP
MSVTDRSPNVPEDSKTVLICSGCDRTAPMGEAWRLKRREDRTEIECPDCESVVVSQPQFGAERSRTPISAC